jgi:hypothetical protein
MQPARSQAEILLAAVISGYRPYRRIMLFALAYVFDNEQQLIPVPRQPSLTDLAHMTGMNRRTVMRQLGWLEHAEPVRIRRDRPSLDDARRYHLRTAYTVLVPSDLNGLGAAGGQAGGSGTHQLGAPGPGLGAAGGQAGGSGTPKLGTSGPADLDDEEDSSIRVREDTRVWEHPALVAAAVEELGAAGFKISAGEGAEITRQVLAGRQIRTTPENYLRQALRKTPRLYVPAREQQPRFERGPELERPTREQIQAVRRQYEVKQEENE